MLISIFNSLISWQATKWLRESYSSTVPLKINAGFVINTVDLFLSLILSSSLLWISNETASHWATLLEKKAWEQRQSLWILFHAHTHRENKLIKFTSLLHYSVPYTAADTEYWFAEGTDKTTSALGLWKWERKRHVQIRCLSKKKLFHAQVDIFRCVFSAGFRHGQQGKLAP